MPDPIKHVVLLMMENHSFDQMLGAMKTVYPSLEGVDPSRPNANKDSTGQKYAQLPNRERNMVLDPQHEVEHVSKQLAKQNSGFVLDFEGAYKAATPAQKQQIMGYFPLDFLPALHPLARDFAVCDHWFSSLPGPTWPNRFFALSGTSCGATMMPEDAQDPDPVGFVEQNQDTIFDRLNEGGISWQVFYHDFPLSLMLRHQHDPKNAARYASMESFQKAAQGRERDFPQFCLIEPRYCGEDQNDDHPPHDIMRAQRVIADVYNRIRANGELWNSTLLVVTYDEHGGFYDHVVPPRAVPPDDLSKGYTFNQYGVRVPTILVSPWVDRGVVNTVFDHTSLLKYLLDKWGLKPLTRRVSAANSIAPVIRTQGPARTDIARFLAVPDADKAPSGEDIQQAIQPYVSANHRVITAFMHQMTVALDLKVPGGIASVGQAIESFGGGISRLKAS